MEFTGRALEEEIGAGWMDGVHPEDRSRLAEASNAALEARRPLSSEYRLRRHDGQYRWIRDNVAPYFLDDGILGGFFGSATDVSDQVEREAVLREAQTLQEGLIADLNHRVKNTLATVQSIAVQTFQRVQDCEMPLQMFQGRLNALSRTQDLLTRRRWRGTTLQEVVESAVSPFVDSHRSAVEIGGPDVLLTPKQTMALSFALHELCNNAARHGALSSSGGRVIVHWETRETEDGTTLLLSWREQGGPPVAPPDRKGFGVRMIERGLRHEFSATSEIEFAPDGLVCTIRATLGS